MVLGDLNFDSQIDVLDVVLLVGFALENDFPTDVEFIVSDVNEDGQINVPRHCSTCKYNIILDYFIVAKRAFFS